MKREEPSPKGTCAESLSTGPCGKEAIDGSDRCIFHHPEMWKECPELVLERIRRQVTDGDYDFEGYNFPEIDFSKLLRNMEFELPVNFMKSRFHGEILFNGLKFKDASFKDATFFEKVVFLLTVFNEDADFTGVNFFGDACFSDACFSKGVWFTNSRFHQAGIFTRARFLAHRKNSISVDFKGARFTRDADFWDAEFSGDVELGNILVSGDAFFFGTKFLSDVYADDMAVSGMAIFQESKFFGSAFFENARFSSRVSLIEAVFSRDTELQFLNATFAGLLSLQGIALDSVLLDFRGSVFGGKLFVDEMHWSQKGCRLRIEDYELEAAIENYRLLRKAMLASGSYSLAGNLFYNEMDCRRRLIPSVPREFLASLLSTAKRIRSLPFLNSGCVTVMKKLAGISALKRARNLVETSSQNTRDSGLKPAFKKLSDMSWMNIFYFTCGYGERPMRVVGTSLATICLFALIYSIVIPTSIINGLYLSLDCFVALATLRHDIIPFSLRWLTYVEAGLGIALTSLFLVVFTRKMARD